VPIYAALRQGPHIKVAAVASRWQRVVDLNGLGDMNTIQPSPEALPLVLSGAYVAYYNLRLQD